MVHERVEYIPGGRVRFLQEEGAENSDAGVDGTRGRPVTDVGGVVSGLYLHSQ